MNNNEWKKKNKRMSKRKKKHDRMEKQKTE